MTVQLLDKIPADNFSFVMQQFLKINVTLEEHVYIRGNVINVITYSFALYRVQQKTLFHHGNV